MVGFCIFVHPATCYNHLLVPRFFCCLGFFFDKFFWIFYIDDMPSVNSYMSSFPILYFNFFFLTYWISMNFQYDFEKEW